MSSSNIRVRINSDDSDNETTQMKKIRDECDVAIDFGASKSIIKYSFNNLSHNHQRRFQSGKISRLNFCSSKYDQSLSTRTTFQKKKWWYVTSKPKHKIGLSLESGPSRPKLFIQCKTSKDSEKVKYKQTTAQNIIEEIFYQIIKNLLSQQAQFLFGSEKKIPKNQTILISYPNTDSVIQKIHDTKLWKKTLSRIYMSSGWNGDEQGCGKLFLYIEAHIEGKIEVTRVVLTGGEMRNTQLQNGIRIQCFPNIPNEKYIVKSERMRVCVGLFERHRYGTDSEYSIE